MGLLGMGSFFNQKNKVLNKMKGICTFNKSILGKGHQRKNDEYKSEGKDWEFVCQDRSYSAAIPSIEGGFLSIVCDGHGGEPYFRSERGAQFAIDAVKDCVTPKCIDTLSKAEEEIFGKDFITIVLTNQIVKKWRELVKSDLTAEPITLREYLFLDESGNAEKAKEYRKAEYENRFEDLYPIYGTTLLVVIRLPSLWIALQIGDGSIVVRDKNGFFKPDVDDKNNSGPWTISISNKQAENLFHIDFGRTELTSVFCASDGLDFKNKTQQFFFYAKDVLTLFHDYEDKFERNSKPMADFLKLNVESALEAILPNYFGDDDLSLSGISTFDLEADLQTKKKYDKLMRYDDFRNSDVGTKNYLNYFKFHKELASKNGYGPSAVVCAEMVNKIATMQKSPDDKMKYMEKEKIYLNYAFNAGIEEALKQYASLLYEEGKLAEEKKSFNDAFNFFSQSVEYVDLPECLYKISLYYGRPQDYTNCGVKQNFKTAFEFVKKSAKLGYAEAQCKLGRCLRDGRGIPKNENLSVEWYKKAANNGNAEAMYELGQYYLKTPDSFSIAEEWIRKASEKGYKEALSWVENISKQDVDSLEILEKNFAGSDDKLNESGKDNTRKSPDEQNSNTGDTQEVFCEK